jgi:hypothetical protein
VSLYKYVCVCMRANGDVYVSLSIYMCVCACAYVREWTVYLIFYAFLYVFIYVYNFLEYRFICGFSICFCALNALVSRTALREHVVIAFCSYEIMLLWNTNRTQMIPCFRHHPCNALVTLL